MARVLLVCLITLVFLAPHGAIATEVAAAGTASWYGGGEKLNKHTACGEVFDPQQLTCASWEYDFHTRLVVTNVDNGKSVVVRVNDRGPNKRLGRIIDLSRAAFASIADTKEGLVSVRVEKITP